MNEFIQGILTIFQNPPVLMALVVMLGLILLGKKTSDIIKGMFAAAFGMFILQTGVGLLSGSITQINDIFGQVLGTSVSTGLDDVSFTAAYGAYIGIAMVIGLVLHVLIARFTRFKVIFLTGQFLWWIPFIFIAAGVESGLTGAALVIFGAILSALYWSLIPSIMRPFVRAVIGDDSFTLGHPASSLALISGTVAKYVGNKEKSTEDINVPQSLNFFKEISVTGAIVIFIVYIVIGLIWGDYIEENVFVNAINNAITFGAGLVVMLYGVRMLVNQIIPAFQGISEKIVPDAIPALDCPVLFNYKPNAALIGFVVATIVSTILVVVVNISGIFGVLLIPLVFTSFFECGTAAVIAEGQGGLRGAIIGTSVAASVMVVLVGISAILYESTIQNWILIFGGNDLSLFGSLANLLGGIF